MAMGELGEGRWRYPVLETCFVGCLRNARVARVVRFVTSMAQRSLRTSCAEYYVLKTMLAAGCQIVVCGQASC